MPQFIVICRIFSRFINFLLVDFVGLHKIITLNSRKKVLQTCNLFVIFVFCCANCTKNARFFILTVTKKCVIIPLALKIKPKIFHSAHIKGVIG